MCSAPALFSQSLVLQLVEGYFWQSLSCPFPCTFPLAAAVIVPAVSEYLGRAQRNLISELCTQITCYSSLSKLNYPSSVVSSALLSVWSSSSVYSVQSRSKTPLWGSLTSHTEMADMIAGTFTSTPSCINWWSLFVLSLPIAQHTALLGDLVFLNNCCTIHCSLLPDCGFLY